MRQAVEWFERRGWRPFPFQRRTWRAYGQGKSGLVQAPTGTGKSYAAWFGPASEALRVPTAAGEIAPLQIVWITPLRALAHDLGASLGRTARELELPWSVEARTGDTAASIKRRQRQRLPTVLVTTPESLTLLLSYPGCSEAFRTLRSVVVDEWHELVGTKRGVQTELALARLRRFAPELRVWGLSATLGDTRGAMEALLGDRADEGELIRHASRERVQVETLVPLEMERLPWAGHLGRRLMADVALAVEGARSTLLFTNTRSQAELWHRGLLELKPEWEPQLGLHHGSLDADYRRHVETRLSAGELRCVVCTSSLDLGVDFPQVDQIVQVGGPKGIGRLLQRAGRSGHRPGETSRILCVPTHALELVEFSAAKRALRDGDLEAREPLRWPLDVLVQHVVTSSLAAGADPDRLLAEVRTTHAYRGLPDEAWRWVLDFVEHGGSALGAYPRYRKLVRKEGRLFPASEEIERLHRAAIGTISADQALEVRFGNGTRLGTIEELFVARLRPGDRFVFTGRTLELVRVQDAAAVVRTARKGGGSVPRWHGGTMPLSSRLAARVREALTLASRGRYPGPEMQSVRGLLREQQAISRIPAEGELLVERTVFRGRHLLYFFPFEGRSVHEGLAALVGHRLARRRALSMTATVNDYGFELSLTSPVPLEDEDIPELLRPDRILEDLERCLNTGELTRRRFRDVARVAGLISLGLPGRPRRARQLQSSSGLLFDVLERYDPENLLLQQARREVLEEQLEVRRLQRALERMERSTIHLVDTETLTPLAFPLWAESLRAQQISSESWEQRVRRVAAELSSDAGVRQGG